MLQAEVHVALRCHQLQAVAFSEFVFYGDGGQRAFTLAGEVAYKLLAFGNRIAMLVVLVVVVGMSTQETFGITAMRQAFQRFQQAGVERFTGGSIVDGFAIHLRGTSAVVVGLGAAFDFQGVYAHLG